jgi:dephospho-CoA kinase
MPCPLRIGLTGGIGSGKSEAARQFARLGATVIDTDLIARQLVEPGQAALAEIVDAFGAGVLDADGRLNRDRLRQQVFADPSRRRLLESILHPRIRARALLEAGRAQAPYCLLVIPLLAETGDDYRLDRVLLIDCPENLQRQRARARDALSEADLDAILAAQASRAARQAIADDIILNDADLQALTVAVRRLHQQYETLAGKYRDSRR